MGTIADEVLAPYAQIGTEKTPCLGAAVAIRVAGKVRILTAAHLVGDLGDEEDLLLVKEDPRELHWRARKHRVGNSGITDLALLRLWRSKHLVVARFNPRLRVLAGEDCWYVGTPRGLHQSLEKSIINRPLARLNGVGYTLVNGNGTYGNSGGPLYVRRHGHFYLAGIISRGVNSVHQNPRTPIAAVSVAHIAAFLAREKAVGK